MAKKNWKNEAPKPSVKEGVRVHTHNGAPLDFDNESDAVDFVHEARYNPKSSNAHLFREDEPVQLSTTRNVVWDDEDEEEEEYSPANAGERRSASPLGTTLAENDDEDDE